MHVRAFSAEHFRNLTQVQLEPHPRFNVLFGDNGQGKTNILEAIYLLATLRSFRTSRPGATDELIQLGERTATVRARVEREGVERLLAVQLGGEGASRKLALVDGKAARSGEYFGGVNAILFSPDDLRLPKGPPAQRRRFLDRAVWNSYPGYLKEVQTYERVLRSRNALLRSEGRGGSVEEMLPIYDEQLASAGALIMCRRGGYLAELRPEIASAFDRVGRSGLPITVRYRGTVPLAEEDRASDAAAVGRCADELRARLLRDRRRDQLRGFTHSGPHADDLELELAEQPAAQFASQGQLRALILALKIAEIRHLRAVLGDSPVLLLDDVSSELDPQRNQYLFEFLREIPCQAFITTTSAAHIQLAEERQDVRVEGGCVTVA